MTQPAERKNPWPMRVLVGLLCFLVVWFIGLSVAVRWGSDEIKCAMAVGFGWSAQKTERICTRAYPDTWRKELSP